jgi:hypothetical protein
MQFAPFSGRLRLNLTCTRQHEISRHRSMSDLRCSSRVKDKETAALA